MTKQQKQRLVSLIRAELHPSEKIAWMSAPRPGRLAMRALGAVVSGITLCVCGVFFLLLPFIVKIEKGADGAFFAFAFVVFGLGAFCLYFWRGIVRNANKTAYVVTNERVIISDVNPFGQRMTRTFLPHQLTPVSRIQRKDGSGDLVLSNDGYATTGFFGILDVKNVETLVLALAGSSAKEEV
jgi:lipopolysaccharide/colanic/teichoic acid biosynthesis glycosyltransferase